MAHPQQRRFFESVKAAYPASFHGVRVVDCGSLDINGTLKDLFVDAEYVGVDIRPGQNVDVVSTVHDVPLEDGAYDTVVSSEMLEHDEHWDQSLRRMYALLKPGGLLVISAAGKGRKEHGSEAVPDGSAVYGTSPSYYRNLVPQDIQTAFHDDLAGQFTAHRIARHKGHRDLYFYGVKR